ncbi:MAG: PAS domain S-box protein [Bacteroidota bacterium]|nr:PAS domain S-box protein [Bacteroidota bacterium]
MNSTILSVEDDALLALLGKRLLTNEGFCVIQARNGEDAISIVKEKHDKIDLILMDIDLGHGINGISAAKEILKEFDIPLIFLSSETRKEIIKEAEELPIYGYFIKGSENNSLFSSIRASLRLHKEKKEILGKIKFSQKQDQNSAFPADAPEEETLTESPFSDNALKEKASDKKVPAEKTILENIKDYKLLIDNMGEGFAIVDQFENIIYANRAGEITFGLEPGKFTGRNLKSFCDPTETKLLFQQTEKRQKGLKSVYELKIKLDSGQKKTILVTATPRVNEDGRFTGTFGIFRDVTERKEAVELIKLSEQRFRDIAKNVPGALYQFRIRANRTSYLSYVSEQITEMFGFPVDPNSPEWTLGKHIPEEDRDRFFSSIYNAMNSRSIWEYEGNIICNDGTIKWFQGKAVPMQIGDELVYNGIILDLTEHKQAERLLQHYAEELKLLNATKDKFLSIIAHDLRGPFSGFMGITEDLARNIGKLSNEEISEIADIMHSTSTRIFSLLTNLLEWSRLQTGKFQMKVSELTLYYEVEEVISLFSSSAASKSLEIKNNVNLSAVVYTDYNVLSTILRNLISNALKFTPSGGKITIDSRELDSSAPDSKRVASLETERFIEISVKDSGMGINEEDILKLFRIDTCFSTRGTSGEKGSGLGLILCKELIEKNRGKIKVKSTPGNGTEFTFTLPGIKKAEA